MDASGLHKLLTGERESDDPILVAWAGPREHLKKTPEQKADENIDIEREREAFGPDATTAGRSAFYKEFGNEYAEARRKAWGAGFELKSGIEPGTEAKQDEEVVVKAKKIVSDESSNSPFNPAKKFESPVTRANECAKFINRFGTKAAQAQCAKFSCDIAGRPLQKQA